MSNSTSVLPNSFHVIARFAGREVLLRGIGVNNEYNYTIHDVLLVSEVYDRFNVPIDDSFRHVRKRRRQVLALHNAYKRHLQSI